MYIVKDRRGALPTGMARVLCSCRLFVVPLVTLLTTPERKDVDRLSNSREISVFFVFFFLFIKFHVIKEPVCCYTSLEFLEPEDDSYLEQVLSGLHPLLLWNVDVLDVAHCVGSVNA